MAIAWENNILGFVPKQDWLDIHDSLLMERLPR